LTKIIQKRSESTASAGIIGMIDAALGEGRTVLSEHESKEVLRAYAIPVTKEREVHDEKGFKEALAEIGFPLVIKASGPDLSHKTERGLVHVDIRNQREAMAAFKAIRSAVKAERAGVLIQEMIKGKRELMAGLIRDPQFGPCVTFGLGGIFMEIFRDIAFRVAPVDRVDVLDMISELKGARLLESYRGMPAADMDQLIHLVMQVGTIGLEQPGIREIDINPIIISGSRPVAVDALIVLNS
jgi:acetate---CoA ligase (ADP-forming) subunit beta